MAIGLILLGAGLIGMSVLAFTGRWRKWASKTGYASHSVFCALYLGVALIVSGTLIALPRGTVPEALALGAVLLPLWSAIIGYFWTPKSLLPRWFKNGRAAVRAAEKAYADIKREYEESRNDLP